MHEAQCVAVLQKTKSAFFKLNTTIQGCVKMRNGVRKQVAGILHPQHSFTGACEYKQNGSSNKHFLKHTKNIKDMCKKALKQKRVSDAIKGRVARVESAVDAMRARHNEIMATKPRYGEIIKCVPSGSNQRGKSNASLTTASSSKALNDDMIKKLRATTKGSKRTTEMAMSPGAIKRLREC